MKFSNTVFRRIKSLKLLLGVGSLSFIAATSGADAAPQALGKHAPSPLFAQASFSQSQVADMIFAIKDAAGGALDKSNTAKAVGAAIASYPAVSPDVFSSAISQLRLNGASLREAVSAASVGLGISEADFVSAMITGTFMNEGTNAARRQVAHLREVLGATAVDDAMKIDETAALFSIGEIEPAAGDEDSSVYSG